MQASDSNAPSRRTFMKTSSLALGATITGFASAHASTPNSETLKVGLVGCGSRGTGAARQALLADPNTQLAALGDTFEDQVRRSYRQLTNEGSGIADRVSASEEQLFAGFDAYKGVIEASDVVVLAAPPNFRPKHMRAAVEAGCHVFCEKPVAVDPPGVRHILETCKMAEEKGLSVVSGLCYRYEYAKRETMQQIHDGAIGDIISLQTNYLTGDLWHKGRRDEWTEMEYQVRNWIYFDWLSGDHINEQHIHSLDKIAWAMGDEYPVKAIASGGRIQRTDPRFGNVYDHFNTIYEWANGVKGFSACRQWGNAFTDINDYVHGTKGTASIQDHFIKTHDGERWRHKKAPGDDMYQNEHNELFASIRNREPINNGGFMSKSTLMAIMGRMSAYSGQAVTWEEAMNSDLDLTPKAELAWGDVDMRPVPVPGITVK